MPSPEYQRLLGCWSAALTAITSGVTPSVCTKGLSVVTEACEAYGWFPSNCPLR